MCSTRIRTQEEAQDSDRNETKECMDFGCGNSETTEISTPAIFNRKTGVNEEPYKQSMAFRLTSILFESTIITQTSEMLPSI